MPETNHPRLAVFFVCFTLFTIGCGPTGAASTLAPSVGWTQTEFLLESEFALRVGQTASLGGGGGLQITLETIDEDSRCPVGLTCVWAGDAVAVVRLQVSSGAEGVFELHTHSRFDREAAFEGYTVRLIELSPVPHEGSTIELEEYRATLDVSR